MTTNEVKSNVTDDNQERDVTLLEHGEGFFSVRIGGATYRNLKRLAEFMKAHDMEGGEGPWGNSLDLETAINLAGLYCGFMGEDAYENAESEMYAYDFEGGDEELEQTVEDVKSIKFE